MERLRTTGWPLQLDHSAGHVSVQIALAITGAVADGRIADGERLPSTRRLAQELRVSRNTVAAAYEELARHGVVRTVHGAGTFIVASAQRTGRPALRHRVTWLGEATNVDDVDPMQAPVDLRLRGGTLAPIANDAWRRAWRLATATVDFRYGDPQGPEEVRQAIADYVARVRGVQCVADDVVLTSGASDALALLLRCTLHDGGSLALEQPGYAGLARIATADGIPLLSVGVDSDGCRVPDLEVADPAPLVVHVTPQHQFPLGVRLSQSRRAALIEWTERSGGLIIENDYDGEFCFGEGAPQPLTASDQTGQVCLVGTFSRLLAPSVRVGYIIATPALARRVAATKYALESHAPLPAQLAVAHLIRSGELERQLRRVRRLIGAKREAIRTVLGGIDGVTLHGLHGGLHVRVECAAHLPVDAVARRLRNEGIHVDQLRDFFWQAPQRNALLVDYGHCHPKVFAEALQAIARALAAGSNGRGHTG